MFWRDPTIVKGTRSIWSVMLSSSLPSAMRTITALVVMLALLFPVERAPAAETTREHLKQNCEQLESYWRLDPPTADGARIPNQVGAATARVNVSKQIRLRRGVDPIAELRHPLVQALPEHEALGDRWRRVDRAEHGDVLVADLAVDPARLDQACLKAALGLAEADEHCSGMLRSRLLDAQAGVPLLASLMPSR
jgi:hypothetical protein